MTLEKCYGSVTVRNLIVSTKAWYLTCSFDLNWTRFDNDEARLSKVIVPKDAMKKNSYT